MQLQLLWELQQMDLLLRDLQLKIEEAPFRSGVEETKEHLECLENAYSERQERLKDERKNLKQLELEEQKIIETRKELYDNMYDGKTTSVKELEQMQRKMDLLAADKKQLEDNILNLMESIEEQEAELNKLEEDLTRSRQELEEKEGRLEEELDQYNNEVEQLLVKREQLAQKIDHRYLDKYSTLAQKHQGEALARVVDDICGGCRVFISSAHRGHLYNPSSMVYCENCGRLLVKLENH